MSINLPPEVPDGFCWRYKGGDEWNLESTEPATLYKIMVGERYHCGYYSREEADRFLLFYQSQYPNEVVRIQEEPSERPIDRSE